VEASAGPGDRAGQPRVGAIRIILRFVNRHCRSSASLPDGTVLVGASRQPFFDAARVLIAAGYDPDSWLEGWRPGATAFALRARLEIAFGLTVDETRTIFAPWKPFSPSAVSFSIRCSDETATTTACVLSALPAARPEQQSKRRRPSCIPFEQDLTFAHASGRRAGPDPVIQRST
jgi:hypothetical protein